MGFDCCRRLSDMRRCRRRHPHRASASSKLVSIFDAGWTAFFDGEPLIGEEAGTLFDGGFDFRIARGEAVIGEKGDADFLEIGWFEQSHWRGCEIGVVFAVRVDAWRGRDLRCSAPWADLPKGFDPTS